MQLFDQAWEVKPHGSRQRKMWGKREDYNNYNIRDKEELLDGIKKGNSLSKFLACVHLC